MKIILLLISLTVLQSYSLTVIAQSLQFYREDIVFNVSEYQVTIDAQYHFCNLSEKDIKTSLFYPFPGNTRELIDTLDIRDLKTDQFISYRDGKAGVFFVISVPAYSQAAYRVYFRQRLEEKHFTYILTSTESWGRSLEFANFKLLIPVTLSIDFLSYPADSTFIQNDIRYFIWKKKDFMPDRDFEITFQ
jgi:hypothetical protein